MCATLLGLFFIRQSGVMKLDGGTIDLDIFVHLCKNTC